MRLCRCGLTIEHQTHRQRIHTHTHNTLIGYYCAAPSSTNTHTHAAARAALEMVSLGDYVMAIVFAAVALEFQLSRRAINVFKSDTGEWTQHTNVCAQRWGSQH